MIESEINKYMEGLIDSVDHYSGPSGDAILRNIQAQHGLIVQRSANVCSFSHLTFQEYFTALYIKNHVLKGTLDNLVENYLFDERWHETILLTASLLPEADDLLSRMNEKIKELPSSLLIIHKLQNVAKLKDRVDKDSLPLMNAWMLHHWIATARNTYGRSREKSNQEINKIVKHTLDIALAMDYLFVNDSALQHARRSFFNLFKSNNLDFEAIKTRAKDRTINMSTIVLNREEVDELSDYIYGCKLILECIQSSIYCSREVRLNLIRNLLNFT